MNAPTVDTAQHPAWCNVEDHRRFVEESDGVLEPAEVTAHYCGGGNAQLSELLNPVSRRIEREAGGSWSLQARQALLAPYTSTAAHAGPPLVSLTALVRSGSSVDGVSFEDQTRLDLTTGEARVLAAHLIALCDRVDLAGI